MYRDSVAVKRTLSLSLLHRLPMHHYLFRRRERNKPRAADSALHDLRAKGGPARGGIKAVRALGDN